MPWRVHSIAPLKGGTIAEISLHNLNDVRDYLEAYAEIANLKDKGVRQGDHVLLKSEPFSGRKVTVFLVLEEERTGEEIDILAQYEF